MNRADLEVDRFKTAEGLFDLGRRANEIQACLFMEAAIPLECQRLSLTSNKGLSMGKEGCVPLGHLFTIQLVTEALREFPEARKAVITAVDLAAPVITATFPPSLPIDVVLLSSIGRLLRVQNHAVGDSQPSRSTCQAPWLLNSSSSALASFRSAVSKPSVNQL